MICIFLIFEQFNVLSDDVFIEYFVGVFEYLLYYVCCVVVGCFFVDVEEVVVVFVCVVVVDELGVQV